MECQCCYYEVLPAQLSRCSKGHAVCAPCQARLGRSDCLFCVPHAAPHLPAPVAPVAPVACCEACLRVLVVGAAFVVTVYAGKVYVWFYLVTQDKQCAWFAWGSFRHCLVDFLVGLFGTAILVGCCLKE